MCKILLLNINPTFIGSLSPIIRDKANFVNRDFFETSAELILAEYNRLFWNIKSEDRLKDGLKSQTVQSR